MLRPAFSLVSILLGICILGVLFSVLMPVLRTSSNVGGSTMKQESVEERVDELVEQIQTQRQQAIEYYADTSLE